MDRPKKTRLHHWRRRLPDTIAAGLFLWLPILGWAAEPEPDELPPFEEVCFTDFDPAEGFPGEDYLKRVLEGVRGQKAEISRTQFQNRPMCRLSGTFRLTPDWREGSVLRLRLDESGSAPTELFFWHGNEGVAFSYFKNSHPTWAAYGTTRGGDEPLPETLALWAVDNGRYRRSEMGTVEVRYQDGKLVMTHGDVMLLCVPFAELPREVYLQAEAKVRGLEMARSQPPAPLPVVSRPVVRRIERPADLQWEMWRDQEEEKDRFTLNKLPDGRVELVAERDSGRAHAAAAVCRPGLYEYIFEVEDAEPGTGIFLADDRDKHLYRAAFFRHKETGKTLFGLMPNSEWNAERSCDSSRLMTPFAGRHQWLRFVVGAGVLKGFTSGDGVHWSQFATNDAVVEGACTTIGLFCSPYREKRAIKLRSIEIRRLDTLTSLVPPEVMRQVGSLAGVGSLEDWKRRVDESRPEDLPENVWRRACMLRTFEENTSHWICQPLLREFLDEILEEPGDWQSKLRLLDEACLLVQVSNYGAYHGKPRYGTYYEALGKMLARQGHPTPFSVASRAIMRMPSWDVQSQALPQGLLHHELLALAQRERWQEVGELCRRVKYWSRIGEIGYYGTSWPSEKEGTIQLIEWAHAQAARHAAVSGPRPQSALAAPWRHPLIERIDKEGFNLLSELDAAIETEAYETACRIICSLVDLRGMDLVSQSNDPRLLVSRPMTVDLAMRRVPALRETMQQQFGSLGKLRIERAIADGDPAAVEEVAVQFSGTEAAAEAHRWLGDRRLSCGQFARAEMEYCRALRSCSSEGRAALSARLRLAGAMMGRDVEPPVTEDVLLGSARLTAGQFEQMVRQARQSRQGSNSAGSSSAEQAASTLRPSPPPGDYEARPWARIDGSNDRQPGELPREGFDWGARQIACTVADGRMIVNNQTQLAAFELDGGRQRWLKRRDLKGREPQWSLASFQPVVDRGRIYTRWLGDEGPELACFDAADGKLLWSSWPDGPVVCDPLLAGEELFALTVRCDLAQTLTLELVHLDPQSGGVFRRVPLAVFQDYWWGALPCRAVLVEGEIVATLGGTVLVCDLEGRVRWLRRQIYAPPTRQIPHAAMWLRHAHAAGLVADGRIYATQPGVWAVECIEMETGRLVWRKALPEMIALAGKLDSRLIVETTDGLLALDTRTGDVLWRRDVADRLDTRIGGGAEAICCVRLEPPDATNPGKPRRPMFVWIDPQTGETATESTLNLSKDKGVLLGPVVVREGRQWAMVGSADKPALREIQELLPAKP